MDHSHAADKSIKHYADAKRVPMRKVAHQRCGLPLPICIFHLPHFHQEKERQTRGWDRIKT